MDKNEILKKLQAPFPPEEIEWRIGATSTDKKRGIALAYVTNRAIQNRLDDIFGCFGWKNEYKEWRDKSQICGISVYDDEKQEWVTKWDGADNSNFEATKGGLSDAMKRAGYQWGIGRYLYNLDTVWVQTEVVGKSVVMAQNPPTLPSWALPEGYIVPVAEKGKPQETQYHEQKPTTAKTEGSISRKSEIAKLKKEKGLDDKGLQIEIEKLQLARAIPPQKLSDLDINVFMQVIDILHREIPKKKVA